MSGRRMRRKEDPPLLQGRGNYVDDVVLHGVLYAAFVRSPEAHARITSIDASAALARPGVRAVYTGNDVDLGSGLPLAWVPPGVDVQAPEHWPLAKEVVKHVGDPVARRHRRRPVRGRRRRRGRARRLRPAAGRDRPRGRARGRRPRAPGPRHEQGPRVVARRRRRERAGVGRGGDRAPLRQPPHRRRADRDARRARRLPRGRPDGLELDADPELPAAVPRAACSA